MSESARVDLIEVPAADPAAVTRLRDFYAAAFGWAFTSYGDGYVDTRDAGTTVGVNGIPDPHLQRSPLAVLHVADLDAARASVLDAGGTIIHEPYPFPGGRRFHFADPSGNELAIWSE